MDQNMTSALEKFGFTLDFSTLFSQETYDYGCALFDKNYDAHTAEPPNAKAQRDEVRADWETVELPDESVEAWNTLRTVIWDDTEADPRRLAGWSQLTKVLLSEVAEMLKYEVSLAAHGTKAQPDLSLDEMAELRAVILQIAGMTKVLGKDLKEREGRANGLALPKKKRGSAASKVHKRTDSNKLVRFYVDGAPTPYSAITLPKALGRPWTYASLVSAVEKAGETLEHGWDRAVTKEDEDGNEVETDERVFLDIGGHKITCTIHANTTAHDFDKAHGLA